MTSQDFDQSTGETELQYWLKREQQERDAASAAKDQSAREAHIALAKHYADKAHGISERDANAAVIPSGLWPKNGGRVATPL